MAQPNCNVSVKGPDGVVILFKAGQDLPEWAEEAIRPELLATHEPGPEPEPEPEAPEDQSDSTEPPPDLERWRVTDLAEYARSQGIDLTGTRTKQEIIDRIRE